MRDFSNNTKAVTCQDAKVFSADTDGTTVDRQGFESVMFIVNSFSVYWLFWQNNRVM